MILTIVFSFEVEKNMQTLLQKVTISDFSKAEVCNFV